MSHEGFDIDKDFISRLSKTIDKMEGGTLTLSIKESPKIMGRNLYVVLTDEGTEIDRILSKKE